MLSAEEGAEVILGHYAQTREELCQLIDSDDWDSLLRKVKVNTGDFLYAEKYDSCYWKRGRNLRNTTKLLSLIEFMIIIVLNLMEKYVNYI